MPLKALSAGFRLTVKSTGIILYCNHFILVFVPFSPFSSHKYFTVAFAPPRSYISRLLSSERFIEFSLAIGPPECAHWIIVLIPVPHSFHLMPLVLIDCFQGDDSPFSHFVFLSTKSITSSPNAFWCSPHLQWGCPPFLTKFCQGPHCD